VCLQPSNQQLRTTAQGVTRRSSMANGTKSDPRVSQVRGVMGKLRAVSLATKVDETSLVGEDRLAVEIEVDLH
jgi:hypothetical protein